MKVEIIASYDEKERILKVKNEHDVEWRIETGLPEVYLSSLIGASFSINVKAGIDASRSYKHKYKLTIEKL